MIVCWERLRLISAFYQLVVFAMRRPVPNGKCYDSAHTVGACDEAGFALQTTSLRTCAS